MNFVKTKIDGVFEIELARKFDDRGSFMRVYDYDIFLSNIPGFCSNWVQVNHSFTALKNTWRGFHFQQFPYQESKLIKCLSGRVIDCVLDLRIDSSTYLHTHTVELSKKNENLIFIPKGCAHGFLSLEDNSELLYFHDQYYNPKHECGVKYNDKKIHFSLKLEPEIISEKDRNHPDL